MGALANVGPQPPFRLDPVLFEGAGKMIVDAVNAAQSLFTLTPSASDLKRLEKWIRLTLQRANLPNWVKFLIVLFLIFVLPVVVDWLEGRKASVGETTASRDRLSA